MKINISINVLLHVSSSSQVVVSHCEAVVVVVAFHGAVTRLRR